MRIDEKELIELKDIYFKLYKRVLNDEEVLELANRLLGLFKIIVKPINSIDSANRKIKNGARNG